ncbi:sodium/proton antiporter, CPA1 family [Pedococcus cremeus]|uniref:Sodium/proton antiporter, CPA1 family n=1 Tax=Pedococcus cremeus TaxID=587636 RepID=A0A1H9X974_9MICO|nr:Na+/H+ antiporter [Pedococcus cremeus]SES42682.1 sodium/proton antiporter, CPA1 family [Pedococcus cremeus]
MTAVHLALTLLAVVATVTAVAGLSRRLGLSAPLALIVTGVVGSYLPFIPEPRLSSEVVLVGLLPPLLYAAAIRTSLVDFRANKAVIGSLSVGLVVFTALGVGVVAWWLLPIPFVVAFALGAVVAPPDAVAATAVARRIGLPRRLVTILEGESLVNDATALVSLRTAIAAVSATAAVSFGSVALDFGWAVLGGVAFGLAAAVVVGTVRRFVEDPVIDTSLSFMTPFLAYLPAEELHSSGVLAVVVAGLLLSHRSPVLQSAASRTSERINWATLQFLLENAVFLMIGLQMRRIVSGVASSDLGLGLIVGASVAVLLTVMLLRPVWVFPLSWLAPRIGGTTGGPVPWQHTTVLSWAAMRGVVTLAAALVLPLSTPHRDVLVFIAMVVTVGTLLVQGLTLPWVARRLGVRGPDLREDALAEATVLQQAVAAGLKVLDAVPEIDHHTAERLRQRAEDRTTAAWERLGRGREDENETPSEAYRRARLLTLAAERAELLRLRDSGAADHHVLSTVMVQLDIEESLLERLEDRSEAVRDTPLHAPESLAAACKHLEKYRRPVQPLTPRGCPDCEREGLVPVHLRLCLVCGNVGCCDSSVGRHAERHFKETGHPVIRSFEPGEAWRWCYVDEVLG